MPHHISSNSLPFESRRPYLLAFVQQVKRQLTDPSLKGPERDRILNQLAEAQAVLDSFKNSTT